MFVTTHTKSFDASLTLGAHAQRGLLYFGVCVCVCNKTAKKRYQQRLDFKMAIFVKVLRS